MDKKEVITTRVTEPKREQIQAWADEHGVTEADAIRKMIDDSLYDQERIDQIQADEELNERLERIEKQVKQLDTTWWERIFG